MPNSTNPPQKNKQIARNPDFMKINLTTILCTAIILCGCSKSPKPDSLTLQGTWTGQEVGAASQNPASLVLAGTNLEYHGSNPQEWYKATYTLHEETTPKQLDAVITDCPLPIYIGKTAHVIYKLEDGKLTMTGNEPGNPAVPPSFDAQAARHIIFTQKQ
jgi:uncharacterized protein (TIGR03067 family)